MRFNSVKGSDFSSSARAVNKNSDAAFDASRKSSFDFTGVSNAAIAARSTERRAAMKAEALKDQTQIKAEALVKGSKIKAKSDLYKVKSKEGSNRMAGVVGALGSVAGGFMLRADKAAEKLQRDKDDLRDQKRDAQMLAILNKPQPVSTFTEKPPVHGGTKTDTGSTDTTTTTTTTTSAPTSTSTSPTSSSTTYTPAIGTGGMTSQFKTIYDLAVKDGRSKFPEIVAAQAMHETGHLNPDISSVYNSSGGTNPFGQTGDRGYGTMTRQGDSSGWSNFPDLQTAVSDHITLWHDTGNHPENYNAHGSASDGLSRVIPAYSPNSDPANQTAGFTESGYSASVKKILRDNGFDVK